MAAGLDGPLDGLPWPQGAVMEVSMKMWSCEADPSSMPVNRLRADEGNTSAAGSLTGMGSVKVNS